MRGMADIKSALRNIPDMQRREERASVQQLNSLRSFGYFSEEMIKGLGTLQASYLIEQAHLIKEDGSARIDAANQKPRKKAGFGTLVFLVLLATLAIVLVRKYGETAKDDPSRGTETQREEISPDISKEAERAKPLNLAEIQYPATVQTTKLFSLSNKEGKETPIALGTTIEIIERSDLGTLKMEIDGELFVGNESRIDGSIELK
jgi:hypothetical protein